MTTAKPEYLESSKTLQTLDMFARDYQEIPEEIREMTSVHFKSALSRNTSVTTLNIDNDVVGFASATFQELLTCTQTLQKLVIVGSSRDWYREFDDDGFVALVSALEQNTSLQILNLGANSDVGE
jgi:hypothetical protein